MNKVAAHNSGNDEDADEDEYEDENEVVVGSLELGGQ